MPKVSSSTLGYQGAVARLVAAPFFFLPMEQGAPHVHVHRRTNAKQGHAEGRETILVKLFTPVFMGLKGSPPIVQRCLA